MNNQKSYELWILLINHMVSVNFPVIVILCEDFFIQPKNRDLRVMKLL